MATNRWVGQAPAIFDIWTISLSGTVTSQTYSITINGKSVAYVAGSGDTVASILSALASNWASLQAPPPPEFQELTPVVSGSTIVATANTAGNPCAISVSTGGGAAFTINHTQSATGPNDFTNPLNWSTGSAPANSDTLVFDNGSASCSYNLNTSLTGITLMISPGYTGKIGLPFINNNASTSYTEYRTTSLTFAGGNATINGPSVSQCNLAFGANLAAVRVIATGRRISTFIPVVLISGGNSSSALAITAGDVGIAYYEGTTAEFPTISTSYNTSAVSDVTLNCGPGATLGVLSQNGGNVTIQSGATTVTVGEVGGTFVVQDGSVTTLNAYNGTIVLNTAGTIGTLNMYNNAVLNCISDPRAKTITTFNVYSSSVTINDISNTIEPLTLVTANITPPNVNRGPNTAIVYT